MTPNNGGLRPTGVALGGDGTVYVTGLGATRELLFGDGGHFSGIDVGADGAVTSATPWSVG